MKTFLGLSYFENPKIKLHFMFSNYMSLLLFVGIGYFLTSILYGTLVGPEPMYYIQEVTKSYFSQAMFLVTGFIFAALVRAGLTKLMRLQGMKDIPDYFFFYQKSDKVIYTLIYILIYLNIVELIF